MKCMKMLKLVILRAFPKGNFRDVCRNIETGTSSLYQVTSNNIFETASYCIEPQKIKALHKSLLIFVLLCITFKRLVFTGKLKKSWELIFKRNCSSYVKILESQVFYIGTRRLPYSKLLISYITA